MRCGDIDDWKAEILQLKEQGLSLSQITEQVKPLVPDKTDIQIFDMVRRAIGRKKINMSEKPVGVIGDLHAPFNHPNYLQFCIDTFKKYGVGQVVCIGDLVDYHALSRHETEPCAMGAYAELDKAIEQVELVTKAFPRAKMCIGNHDTIPVRQAATVGIGQRFLKSYSEVLGLPKTWELADEFIIDDVLYSHGINCAAENGAVNKARMECMSVVIGHAHSFGGCKYIVNPRNIRFGLSVGCGIDAKAYAFAYGKPLPRRPILGCGIVYDSGRADFVPMGMEYFRD